MPTGKIFFVVNPHAANGETGRQWPLIQAKARERLGPFRAQLTAGTDDATRITRQALQDGAELIVCIGGDGTLNEVVNGFMDEKGPIRPEAVLGFVPNGTGCDFVRTVPIPADLDSALNTIRAGHTRTLDLGRLRFADHRGGTGLRYFHNIASFGMGGEVVDRVNRTSKALGPFVSFMWGTLVSLMHYHAKRVRLKVDDYFDREVAIWHVAVGNGRYHGGGMLVAPDALVDDGLFHITIVSDMTLPRVFTHLPKLYNGKIKTIRQVSTVVGKTVSATSSDRVLLDVDGEQPGFLPATIDIAPAAIRMITQRG